MINISKSIKNIKTTNIFKYHFEKYLYQFWFFICLNRNRKLKYLSSDKSCTSNFYKSIMEFWYLIYLGSLSECFVRNHHLSFLSGFSELQGNWLTRRNLSFFKSSFLNFSISSLIFFWALQDWWVSSRKPWSLFLP